MKIDVFPRRQLNSEGSGGSRNRRFSRRFSEGVKSAPLGGILADFCDFGGPIGFQKGFILGPKGNLFRGVILGLIFVSFWEGLAAGAGAVGKGKS